MRTRGKIRLACVSFLTSRILPDPILTSRAFMISGSRPVVHVVHVRDHAYKINRSVVIQRFTVIALLQNTMCSSAQHQLLWNITGTSSGIV